MLTEKLAQDIALATQAKLQNVKTASRALEGLLALGGLGMGTIGLLGGMPRRDATSNEAPHPMPALNALEQVTKAKDIIDNGTYPIRMRMDPSGAVSKLFDNTSDTAYKVIDQLRRNAVKGN